MGRALWDLLLPSSSGLREHQRHARAFGPRSGQRGGGRGRAGTASRKDRSEEGKVRRHWSRGEERSQKAGSETVPRFCIRPGLMLGLERDHTVSTFRLLISHGNASICMLFLQPFICV